MEKLRELIDKKLNNLPEDDLEQILTFVELLEAREKDERAHRPPATTRLQDPLIGLFDGPVQLAEQSETLLERGFEEYAGWTGKKDS